VGRGGRGGPGRGRPGRGPPPGGRSAWGPRTGYHRRPSRTIPGGTHHVVEDSGANARVSWETDRQGELDPTSRHVVDQTDGRVIDRG